MKSPRDGCSTPEVYEIWQGRAVILMQERCAVDRDDPGRCFAIGVGPGEGVVVPPGWAHATISADPQMPLTFGAWCDRAYGFEYEAVRAHGGLAWFPTLDADGRLIWEAKPSYATSTLEKRDAGVYPGLGLERTYPVRSV